MSHILQSLLSGGGLVLSLLAAGIMSILFTLCGLVYASVNWLLTGLSHVLHSAHS